jgi:single-stranded-DNA-specific exonuclease
MSQAFCTNIVGVSFEGRQALLKCLEDGDRLCIVHEPMNEYDPNARAVYYRNARLGYLSRYIAEDLDPNTTYMSKVIRLTGEGYPNQGVDICVATSDTEIESFLLEEENADPTDLRSSDPGH